MTPKSVHPDCHGCRRGKLVNPEWEQETLALYGKPREWLPMCRRCATRRLNNPWNALLTMRRIGSELT